jgi:homoserine dehydrogenase
VGVHDSGEPSLLGRGGSDLTALFLADRLGAVECRLLKDVDGIHTDDPRRSSSAERIERTTWRGALAIGGGVVQDKALQFAWVRGISFRVASLGGSGTVVGPEPVHAAGVRP